MLTRDLFAVANLLVLNYVIDFGLFATVRLLCFYRRSFTVQRNVLA